MPDIFDLPREPGASLIVVAMSGGVDSSVVAMLAARSGARVLFAWCERVPGTSPPRFVLHVEAAPEGIGDADPQRAVAALNAGVEAIARRDFAQYQWTYKRYTLRPPGSGEENPYYEPR